MVTTAERPPKKVVEPHVNERARLWRMRQKPKPPRSMRKGGLQPGIANAKVKAEIAGKSGVLENSSRVARVMFGSVFVIYGAIGSILLLWLGEFVAAGLVVLIPAVGVRIMCPPSPEQKLLKEMKADYLNRYDSTVW